MYSLVRSANLLQSSVIYLAIIFMTRIVFIIYVSRSIQNALRATLPCGCFLVRIWDYILNISKWYVRIWDYIIIKCGKVRAEWRKVTQSVAQAESVARGEWRRSLRQLNSSEVN